MGIKAIGNPLAFYNNFYAESGGTVSFDGFLLDVKLWGAGGGGGTAGGWAYGAEGGGGGFVGASFKLPKADYDNTVLTLQVGEGGLVNGSRMSFGGGGQANRTGTDNRYGSNGGGYTGIFAGIGSTQANVLAIAGGGGGGGSSRAGTGNVGGAGGGTTGQDGVSAYNSKPLYRGTGGTQSAAGVCTAASQGNSYVARHLEGGTAATNGYGGAGGGGYWGGGAGGYSEPNTMGGGGGGSGYVDTTFVVTYSNEQGVGKTSAGTSDTDYTPTVATGGAVATAGLHGYAVITLNGTKTTYTYTGSDVTIALRSIPGGNGLTAATAGTSAYQIKTEYPSSVDGFYYIKGDGGAAVLVYCDMTQDGGGWMLIHRCNGTGTTGATATAVVEGVGVISGATPGTATGTIDNTYKLADADTNYFMNNRSIGIDRPTGHTLPVFRAQINSVTAGGGTIDYFTTNSTGTYTFADGALDFRGIGTPAGSFSDRGWNTYAEVTAAPTTPPNDSGYDSGAYTGWGRVPFYSYNTWGSGVIYNATSYGFYDGAWRTTGSLWYR